MPLDFTSMFEGGNISMWVSAENAALIMGSEGKTTPMETAYAEREFS